MANLVDALTFESWVPPALDMDGKCPMCGLGGRLKSEHRVFKRGEVTLITEQWFWHCSLCEHAYEDDGVREVNAVSVEEAWSSVRC